MRARRHGVIVNVSSDIARAPGPGETAYAASKAALSAFSESLAFALEGSGVHLHVRYPGWVPTEMAAGTAEEPVNQPPKMVRRTEAQVAAAVLGSIGGPRLDIDLAPIARLAPVARGIAPSLYRRALKRATT
jgi:short-subunit dehydrogenase